MIITIHFSSLPEDFHTDKIEVEKIIRDLNDRNIVLVNRGKQRMYVDFRDLKKITQRDNYPLLLIDDQLNFWETKAIPPN